VRGLPGPGLDIERIDAARFDPHQDVARLDNRDGQAGEPQGVAVGVQNRSGHRVGIQVRHRGSPVS
jgi:hypothetical protein